MAQTFDELFYSKFNNLAITLENRPLVLGSVTASNGGSLGRPGGFSGKLAQTLVSYDLTEAEINTIPVSGESLLDNLNRIRYRVNTLEETAIQDIKNNGITVASGVTVLDFDSNFSVLEAPSGEANVHLADFPTISGLFFNTLSSITPSGEGAVYWNPNEFTLNIDTGLSPILQVGQEIYLLIYNDTNDTISNLTVLRPRTATIIDDMVIPIVEKAKADVFSSIEGTLMVSTMDIPSSGIGLATRFGRVRGADTSAFSPGAGLFVSATVSGELVDTRPEFPNYNISMGGVLNSDVEEGEFFVSVTRDIFDTTLNFWNGVFRETINFTVSSDGATITGSLEPDNGHEDMTMMFSDGLTTLDTSPPATIVLTAGTDDIPQTNYVYIPKATKVLTVATGDWPTEEHIKVSNTILRSASTTETDGAYGNRNWNDHIQSTTNDQGHLSHITEKIRQFEAQWHSGIEGSVDIITASSPDDVYFRNTAGKVYQLHKQTFPLLDMNQYSIDAVSTGSKTFTISDDGDLSSTFPDDRMIQVNNSTGNDAMYTVASTSYSDPDFVITVEETIPDATVDGTIGDDIHIVNNFAAPNITTLNLNTQALDSTGSSLTNRTFSFVIWGVQNRTGQASHLMCNLPSGSYNSSASAISDALNYSNYSIPTSFQGMGFLIARATFSLSASGGGSWTLEDLEDLRGKIPNTTAGGGGAGGGGVTTFLALTDTPSAYTGEAGKLAVINAGETALEFGTTITNGFVVEGSTDEVQLSVVATPGVGAQSENLAEYSADGSAARVSLLVYADTGSAGYDFKRAEGSLASPTVVTNNTTLGNLRFYGWDDSILRLASQINVEAAQTWESGVGYGNKMIFQSTRNNSTSQEEWLRYQNGIVRFNELGADIDFRIEGLTDVNLFTLNAGGDFITIGSPTNIAKFGIIATSDEVQFAIKAHASQTENILEIKNSSGTVVTSILPTAGIDINISPTSTYPDGVCVLTSVADSSEINFSAINSLNIAINNGNTSGFGSHTGTDGQVQVRATSADSYSRTIIGINGQISFDATSPYTAEAITSVAVQASVPTFTGTGTLTPGAVSGFRARNQGNSNITTSYGLYVDDQADSTNNYAIFTNAGDISLMASASDAIGFHGATPVAQQTVTGSIAGNLALPSLLSALDTLGLINDTTTSTGITTKTADYPITEDDYTILADATSGTVTITLPASPNQGQIFNIKCINATFTCTIARNGNNIDGSASDLTLALNEAKTLQYDSSFGWAII